MPTVECVKGRGVTRRKSLMWADYQQELRSARKITLAEAATKCGINATVLQYIENGLPFSPELADSLSLGYGLSVKRLREMFKAGA